MIASTSTTARSPPAGLRVALAVKLTLGSSIHDPTYPVGRLDSTITAFDVDETHPEATGSLSAYQLVLKTARRLVARRCCRIG